MKAPAAATTTEEGAVVIQASKGKAYNIDMADSGCCWRARFFQIHFSTNKLGLTLVSRRLLVTEAAPLPVL